MDFGTLLHTAQKNGKVSKKEGVRCYSTKFEPPKKEQRKKQELSDNIKRFLARKEAEENKKKQETLRKKEELMALRANDKKATRCMNVMLKRTKSANQSVLQDATDAKNTSVPLAGMIQPDEDDYGYVSQEASALYNKMMEKYSKMPDEPKFSLSKKKVSTDLNSTRERVKAAIEKEKEEALMPHRRKRKNKEDKAEAFEELESESSKQKDEEPIKKKKIAPPPINFTDLLKLAAKKQYEPIVIEAKPKEEEKLLTKKQKKEMEREKEWRDRREGRLPPLEPTKTPIKDTKNDKNVAVKRPEVRNPEVMKKVEKRVLQQPKAGTSSQFGNSANAGSKVSSNDLRKGEDKGSNKKISSEGKSKQPQPNKDLKPKNFPPPDVRRKEFPPKDVKRKPVVKRRILDDDDEHDSEMDDFIDDAPEEAEDYSKYISEIFGYDKSKYRPVDDDVDNMESTFAQQMKEECISTKIGIMEDLEDIKKEEEEKRRKALMKKRR